MSPDHVFAAFGLIALASVALFTLVWGVITWLFD